MADETAAEARQRRQKVAITVSDMPPDEPITTVVTEPAPALRPSTIAEMEAGRQTLIKGRV